VGSGRVDCAKYGWTIVPCSVWSGHVEALAYHRLPGNLSAVRYECGPDSFRRREVPWARWWRSSCPRAGSTPAPRDGLGAYPGRVDPAAPSPFIVFQDGWSNLNPDGEVRAGIVLDNVVHAGQIPPVVGVFVDPGVLPGLLRPDARQNRNAEYGAVDDRYSTFIATEVLPLVNHRWTLSEDPPDAAITGEGAAAPAHSLPLGCVRTASAKLPGSCRVSSRSATTCSTATHIPT